MTRTVFFAITAVVLVSQAALASPDSFGDRVLACTEISDDVRRLACYDRAAGTQLTADEVVSAEPKPTPVAVAESASAPATASEVVDEFGMTPELAGSQPEKETELREISAKVVKLSKRPRGEFVVTLDNGQTWTEKRKENGFRVKVGDTVVIKKGSFTGAYRMVGRGRRSSQVRRID